MKLIITRHGETEENVAGIMQGHLPGNLTENGVAQTQKVASRLQDEKIDIIYTSDLNRAARTAAAIANYHPEVPVVLTEKLRERCLGELEGQKRQLIADNGIDTYDEHYQPPGGESVRELYARAESLLHEIIEQHHTDNVLFVGHNMINKALFAVIMGKEPSEIREIESQSNTAVNIFEIDEDRNHHIHLYNCSVHLE